MKVFIWFSDRADGFAPVHSALTKDGGDEMNFASFYQPEDTLVQPDPVETSGERSPQQCDAGKNLTIWNTFLIRYCKWTVTKKASKKQEQVQKLYFC